MRKIINLLILGSGFLPSAYSFPGPGHLYQPPVDGRRSPCPALNTLANHGFLPRNGVNVSTADILQYTKDIYGITGIDFVLRNALHVTRYIDVDSSSSSNSNGHSNAIGSKHPVLDLRDTYRIQEADASYGHQDAYFAADAHNNPMDSSDADNDDESLLLIRPPDDELLDGLQAAAGDNGILTLEMLADWQDERIGDSLRRNPEAAWNAGQVGIMAFNSAMLFAAFGNDPTMATVPISNVMSFFRDNQFPIGFVPHMNTTEPARNWLTDPLLVSIQSFFQDRITKSIPLASLGQQSPRMTDCMADIANLRFDVFDYDRYKYYFQESSKVVLAPAGEYYGPDSIEEYVRFADESSPYVSEREAIANKLMFKDVDPVAGTCTFLSYSVQRYEMDPDLSREATFLVGALLKIVYEYGEKYISAVHVHYEDDYLTYFFDTLLNNVKMHNYICMVSEDSCPVTNIALARSDCVQQLDQLPVFTDGNFDGKDYGCRVLHSVFASTNDAHCGHISFEPQTDPKGNIKCQTSKGIQPLDLFDQEDIDDFRDFLDSKESFMDSTIGYKVLDMPSNQIDTARMVLFGLVFPIGVFFFFFCFVSKGDQSSNESHEEESQANVLLSKKCHRLWVILFVGFSCLFVSNLFFGCWNYFVVPKLHPDWEQFELGDDFLEERYRGQIPNVGETSPFMALNDDQFEVFTGFLAWCTCLLTGFGLEVFVWYNFTQVWTKQNEKIWRFAQFSFSMIMLTSIGLCLRGNYLCLPLLILGQWKFGFPEALMNFYLAIYSATNNRLRRTTDFLNGAGLVMHHGAVALIISMTVVGVVQPSRWGINVSLILTIQHWFSLLAYSNKGVYIAAVMMLEYYFEWAVISDFHEIYHLHWTAGWAAFVMVFSHWVYFIAGVLHSFDVATSGARKGNIYIQGNAAINESHQDQDSGEGIPTTRLSSASMGAVPKSVKQQSGLSSSYQLAEEFFYDQAVEFAPLCLENPHEQHREESLPFVLEEEEKEPLSCSPEESKYDKKEDGNGRNL